MTNDDVENIAGRLYEIAAVENLPAESAKRHMADVLVKFVGVAVEEAAREVCTCYSGSTGGEHVDFCPARKVVALKASLAPETKGAEG